MTQPFLNLVKHRVTHSKGARCFPLPLLGSRESQILLRSLGVRLWFYEMHMFNIARASCHHAEKGWVINQSNRNLKGAKSSVKLLNFSGINIQHNHFASPNLLKYGNEDGYLNDILVSRISF